MIRDLFRLTGKVSREYYLAAGALLFALKYALDYGLTAAVFGRQWGWFPYLDPLREIRGVSAMMAVDRRYALAMLALALPFIWIGTAMTTRRLRSAELPGWMVILFFVPVVNLVTIAALCIVRERGEGTPKPKGAGSGAVTALGVAIVFCTLVVWAGSGLKMGYGLGLFIALPFCLGFLSVLIYNSSGTKSFRSSIGVAALSVVIPGIALLSFAMEGLGCLVMALPLALPLACLGGAIAWSIQDGIGAREGMSAMLILLFVFPPGVMCAESLVAPEPPLLSVRTAVDIDAPPDTVWRHVVSFSDLPAPDEWIFHTGIAYPVRASIAGAGPGAIRRCEFSTGPFIEPIQVWDQPRLLRFSVTKNPAPMEEWTPYRQIHPRHLDDFLASRQGQFLLTPLPGGGTRLEGTTWYTHNLWPAEYWQVWSDFIIHKIHRRVLIHIKGLAEVRTPA